MSSAGSVLGIDESAAASKVDLNVWLFFQVSAGHIGLPILVATFIFAEGVKRHPALVNMCFTWIVSGIVSALLFYAGKHKGPEPSHALCIAQASLLYGVPPMNSLAAFALVYIVWSSFDLSSRLEQRKGVIGLYALLIAPYLALVTFAITTAVMASQNVNLVSRQRRFFYCSFQNSPLTNAMAVFSAFVCLASLILEIHVVVHLCAWKGLSSPNPAYNGRRGLDKQLIGRLFVFTGYLLITLVFSAISILSPRTVVPDMFAATIGMAVFLVFGTQSDVLRTWAFWLPKVHPATQSTQTETRSTSAYMPRELRYNQSSLDSSFDFEEKSTLSAFSNIGRRPSSLLGGPAPPRPKRSSHSPLNDLKPVAARNSSSTDTLIEGTGIYTDAASDRVVVIGRPEDAFARMGRQSPSRF